MQANKRALGELLRLHVELTGLQSKPELNGLVGVAQQWLEDKQRYRVKLSKSGKRCCCLLLGLQLCCHWALCHSVHPLTNVHSAQRAAVGEYLSIKPANLMPEPQEWEQVQDDMEQEAEHQSWDLVLHTLGEPIDPELDWRNYHAFKMFSEVPISYECSLVASRFDLTLITITCCSYLILALTLGL